MPDSFDPSLWVDSNGNNWQGFDQVPSGMVSSRFSTVALFREIIEGLCSHLIDNDLNLSVPPLFYSRKLVGKMIKDN